MFDDDMHMRNENNWVEELSKKVIGMGAVYFR